MHLKIQKRQGREYLSVVQNYRQNGKVKSRTIETIGYADTFKDSFPNPVEHFRAYVKELNDTAANGAKPIGLTFNAQDEIDRTATPPARLGASIALGCLDALGVHECFQATPQDGTDYSIRAVFDMLATERMMHATSKREAWTARTSFPRTCDVTYAQVYAALPHIAHEKEQLCEKALTSWSVVGGEPPMGRIFLICGSYSFPVDGGALRASVAVALDKDGMPLSYCDTLGRLEPASFQAMSNTLKERLGARRAVVVAGGLRDVGPTMQALSSTGDGFALYQRDFTKDPHLAAWAEDERGYTSMSSGVHLKWRITERTLPSGSTLPVKEVVVRGGGYATRYSHALLVTSELDMSAGSIVQLYRELWRQAEPFQPLEADFSSMPYSVEALDHIQAHFAICYAAFFALRMLRWKMGWKHNAADTADALLRMEGVHLQQNYYLFNYRSDVTDNIEQAVGMTVARRLRTRSELRGIPKIVRESFTN